MDNYKFNDEFPLNLNFISSVDSTNNLVKKAALGGEKQGFTVIADFQTAGRGRKDKIFYSQKGGIYLSLLLKPENDGSALLLTTAAAVAVSKAIESLSGRETKIKWVNDIFVEDKKVCGILCEAVTINNKTFFVLGVGVNLIKPQNGFNEEIKEIAGYLFESGDFVSLRRKFISELFNEFVPLYVNLPNKEYLEYYRKKNYLLNKTVSYYKEGEKHIATVTGIGENAELIVLNKNKTEKLISGEVTLYLNE